MITEDEAYNHLRNMMSMPFQLMVDRPDFKHSNKDNEGIEFPVDVDNVKEMIIENISQIFDPEILEVDIYNLGLIYGVDVTPEGKATVVMTLTSPNCPAAQELPAMVEVGTKEAPGVTECEIELTFDPPWGPEKMSEDAQLILGMF